MSEKRFASVWDAIEDTPEAAANMKLRSSLMIALTDHIARTEMTQADAAVLFGVTQPRVSDLVRGKINLFGLDALVNMLAAAGLKVELQVGAARSPTKVRRIAANVGIKGKRSVAKQSSPRMRLSSKQSTKR